MKAGIYYYHIRSIMVTANSQGCIICIVTEIKNKKKLYWANPNYQGKINICNIAKTMILFDAVFSSLLYFKRNSLIYRMPIIYH